LCKRCAKNCYKCRLKKENENGPSGGTICEKCNSDRLELRNGECHVKCEDGKYLHDLKEETGELKSECRKCSENCAICSRFEMCSLCTPEKTIKITNKDGSSTEKKLDFIKYDGKCLTFESLPKKT